MPEHLYKSRTNKVFAGVCGGIAEYFKVDPTLIRLAWALAFFVGGTGFILYILAMIIMPDDPGTAQSGKAHSLNESEQTAGEQSEYPEAQPKLTVNSGKNSDHKRQQILGLALVAIGGFFLLEKIFPFFHIGSWWPLILIILGVFVLFKDKGGAR